MKFMMVPPQTSGHSLTHEQVMPFLKKLESGQQREGVFRKNFWQPSYNAHLSIFYTDMLKVMQDLEETSNHSVDILKHFVVSPMPRVTVTIQVSYIPFLPIHSSPSCVGLSRILTHLAVNSPTTYCWGTSSKHQGIYIHLYTKFYWCFFTVLLMTCCRLSLVAWSHMTTVWCQPLLPASLISFCFAKVMVHTSCILLQLHVKSPSLSLPAAQDAVFLLNKLFSLATRSSHDCSSDLLRALEACTQHTHRWPMNDNLICN